MLNLRRGIMMAGERVENRLHAGQRGGTRRHRRVFGAVLQAVFCSGRRAGPPGQGAHFLRRIRRAVLPGPSPLALKIVAFNLAAVLLLVLGMLYLNPFRDSLLHQREAAMLREAALQADLVTLHLAGGMSAFDALERLPPQAGVAFYLLDAGGQVLAFAGGARPGRPVADAGATADVPLSGAPGAGAQAPGTQPDAAPTTSPSTAPSNVPTSAPGAHQDAPKRQAPAPGLSPAIAAELAALVRRLDGAQGSEALGFSRATLRDPGGRGAVFSVIQRLPTVSQPVPAAAPSLSASRQILDGGGMIDAVAGAQAGAGEGSAATAGPVPEVPAVLVVSGLAAEIGTLQTIERGQMLQIFVIAVIVSIGLSLALASTIATPLAELARVAETGGAERRRAPARVQIPDLGARKDEIGRLAQALGGMVKALYDRIEGNEQFAADVAHEIKNPLASLRSAVASLRRVTREDHRAQLLDILDQDVGRMDRLVSDIANASRLDSDLVREEEERFDLTHMLEGLCAHFARLAAAEEVSFVTDLPPGPVMTNGLEGRLAQVFANLIGNALSFSRQGDVIRVWARRRGERLLVVVEDSGPGIPEEALALVFRRFYSHRPDGQFGDHSGLGLAISKQIVEAHGGVIWAENVRLAGAAQTGPPRGARFVVGLPL